MIYKWRYLPPLRSLASCVDGDAWVIIARSLELTAIKLSLSSPINYYFQATFYYSSSKRRKHVKYIQTYWLKFQWRISNWFQYFKCKKKLDFISYINTFILIALNLMEHKNKREHLPINKKNQNCELCTKKIYSSGFWRIWSGKKVNHKLDTKLTRVNCLKKQI